MPPEFLYDAKRIEELNLIEKQQAEERPQNGFIIQEEEAQNGFHAEVEEKKPDNTIQIEMDLPE